MELIKKQTNIDFMGQRKAAAVVSIILIVASITSIVVNDPPFELGLDFTGGTLIEMGFPDAADLNRIRTALDEAGFEDSLVQTFGNSRDIVVRVPPRGEQSSADLSTEVMRALEQSSDSGVPEMRRVEFVGPQVGQELSEKGGLAMLYALIAILFYIIVRFQWRFSVGAVMAIVHDVVITLGIFSVIRLEFDLTVLAAVLAVIGYSLNDTIVVYDRVRENFRSMRKATPVDVFNKSVNQMLSRTLMTSFTTLVVLGALFVFGGDIIHGFATALIIGVVVGTYSSIYVAGTVALMLGVTKQDLAKVEKPGAEASGATP